MNTTEPQNKSLISLPLLNEAKLKCKPASGYEFEEINSPLFIEGSALIIAIGLIIAGTWYLFNH